MNMYGIRKTWQNKKQLAVKPAQKRSWDLIYGEHYLIASINDIIWRQFLRPNFKNKRQRSFRYLWETGKDNMKISPAGKRRVTFQKQKCTLG